MAGHGLCRQDVFTSKCPRSMTESCIDSEGAHLLISLWQTKFANWESINALMTGAKTLLVHFHEAMKGGVPFQPKIARGGLSHCNGLSSRELDFVKATTELVARISQSLHSWLSF